MTEREALLALVTWLGERHEPVLLPLHLHTQVQEALGGERVSYEKVLEHLLQAHGEHLRTTTDPLSLGDFVTVNYVNPLYARAKARPEGAIGRLERFVASGGDTEVLLEGLPETGAYLQCLPAQEAAYWEARRLGVSLSDKEIGDLLRAAAPHILGIEDESRGHH